MEKPQINEWDILYPSNNKNSEYDAIIWNSSSDTELSMLGNPIPVELKVSKHLSTPILRELTQNCISQNFKGLIVITTAQASLNLREFAKNLFTTTGFLLILLDRSDLPSVNDFKSLLYQIKSKLLAIIYGGAFNV